MNDFIDLPKRLYRGNPYYVPDLDSDIRDMFDPRRNLSLKYNQVQAFVAYDKYGTCVGRIAGIINTRANERWQTRNVRFGLIEFVEDVRVAEALLDAVARWGGERGMTHLQGPMGLTDFDKEGMLIEGFEEMGSIITTYNPPYYPQYLEQMGFKKEVDWMQMRIHIPESVPAKYARVAQYLKETEGLRVKKMTNREILKEDYGRRVFQLLNEAYRPIFGFVSLTDEQIDSYISRYIRLIDKQLIPVVENRAGELIGVAVSMGRLSRASKKSGGRLWPTGWWHFLRSLCWQREDTAELLLIGIRPDYQGLGVNALFFDDLIPIYNMYGFRYAETGPQLEDNQRELTQWKPLQPEIIKRRRCYTRKIEIVNSQIVK